MKTFTKPNMTGGILILLLMGGSTQSGQAAPDPATPSAGRVAAVVPGGASASGPVLAQTDAEQAITLLREGLIDSFNKGDFEQLLSHLDTNVVVTWQDGQVCRGPGEVRTYYERMMKSDRPVVRRVSANPVVTGRQIYGDWAVSWGKMHDEFELTDGRTLPLNSAFSATIARRGDHWLVTGFHASVNGFQNPILALAMRKVGFWAGGGGLVLGVVLGMGLSRLRKPKNVS